MGKYKIQKHNVDKEPLTYINTTDITGIIDKSSFLKDWASNLAVDYIKENSDQVSTYLYYVHEETLIEARNAHKQKLEETRDIGSELHKLIESYIKLRIDNKKIKLRSLLKDSDIQLTKMFIEFYIWQFYSVKEFLESEKVVCNQELCVAGTLDFVYIDMTDNVVCCDLKTSNAVYKEHEIQVCGYKLERESMKGDYKIYKEFNGQQWHEKINYDKIKINKCGILNINRNAELSYKEVKNVNNLQEAFKGLLIFYYAYANRRLNNYRAKERK